MLNDQMPRCWRRYVFPLLCICEWALGGCAEERTCEHDLRFTLPDGDVCFAEREGRTPTGFDAIADLDGDSRGDFISAGADGITVVWNDDGHFEFLGPVIPGTSPTWGLLTADSDFTDADVIVWWGPGTIGILEFDESRAPTIVLSMPATTAPSPDPDEDPSAHVGVGDFDGDGDNDIVTYWDKLVFWQRTARSDLQAVDLVLPIELSAPTAGLAVGDFDGDGLMDVFANGPVESAGYIFCGRASAEPVLASEALPGFTGRLRVLDVDRDGRFDLAGEDIAGPWRFILGRAERNWVADDVVGVDIGCGELMRTSEFGTHCVSLSSGGHTGTCNSASVFVGRRGDDVEQLIFDVSSIQHPGLYLPVEPEYDALHARQRDASFADREVEFSEWAFFDLDYDGFVDLLPRESGEMFSGSACR